MNGSRSVRAKKSYGQHFLTSEAIANRIAYSLERTDEYARILEVGPGQGMLTKYLLERDETIFAVEADRDMVAYLTKHLPEVVPRLIQEDFLKVRLEEVMEHRPFALIGNFPYNISSQILLKMLAVRAYVPEMVGMFQREVAERVVAEPGSKTYGVISVFVQAFYTGTYLFTVKAGSFNPPPKVQSAVIRLSRREDQDLGCDEKLFRKVVKAAFGTRRKMLRNTMKPFLPKELLMEEAFFQQRPERLSVAQFVELTQRIEAHRAAE